MTSHKGGLTIDEGAETPVYLALLPANVTEPNGKFVFQKKVTEWIHPA
jgi:carbonyl reductase 1